MSVTAHSVTSPPWEPPDKTIARQLYDWTNSGQFMETEGQNRGPAIDTLEAHFGMKGESWCAMYPSWAAHVVAQGMGVATSFPLTAGSQDLLAKLKALGCVATTDMQAITKMRGALLIRTNKPDRAHGHVATPIERFPGPTGHIVTIGTIEGNSNTNGSSNGDGAYFHHRSVASLAENDLHLWHVVDVSRFPGGSWWPA